MKHIARLALVLLMLFPAVLCLGDEEAGDTLNLPLPAVVINPEPEERLNLRTEPDTASNTQGKFYTGVEVDVIALENGWAEVLIGGGVMQGYMLDDYLLLDARRKDVEPAIPVVTVTHPGGKKMYHKRVSGASVIAHLDAGDTAAVLAVTADDWLFVYAAGDYGFIKNGGVSPSVSFAVPGTAAAGYAAGRYAGVMRDTALYQDESCTDSLDALTRGDLVTVLQHGPQTTLVQHGRNKGYVRSTALNLDCGEWNIPIAEYTALVANPGAQERLNLRTRPDMSAPSLGKYYNGVKVVINGDHIGEWVPVSIGNQAGYMKSEYLAVSGTAKADSVLSAMPILCVTTPAGKLNLRTQPNAEASSLGTYPDGTLVALCGLTDEWAHVLVDGQLGFMLRKYLSDPPY